MPSVSPSAPIKEMEKYANHHFIYLGGGPNTTTYKGVGWSTKVYRAVITRMLDDLRKYRSGKCLFDSLSKRILIVPVVESATTPQDLMGSATSIGSIDDVSYGPTSSNIVVLTMGTGKTAALWDADARLPGGGSEYLIQFTPGFYDRANVLAQSFAGQFRADALLFHELVHAARGTSGVFDGTALSGPLPYGDLKRYTNVDEFVAIMLTNIYRSERYRTLRLRASHSIKFESYRKPRTFWKGSEFQRLMDLFAVQSPSLFWDFAHKVVAQWNPIREYHLSMVDGPCL